MFVPRNMYMTIFSLANFHSPAIAMNCFYLAHTHSPSDLNRLFDGLYFIMSMIWQRWRRKRKFLSTFVNRKSRKLFGSASYYIVTVIKYWIGVICKMWLLSMNFDAFGMSHFIWLTPEGWRIFRRKTNCAESFDMRHCDCFRSCYIYPTFEPRILRHWNKW